MYSWNNAIASGNLETSISAVQDPGWEPHSRFSDGRKAGISKVTLSNLLERLVSLTKITYTYSERFHEKTDERMLNCSGTINMKPRKIK